ncbi:hypothetical protein [Candidatus Magnetobacterium casense]|uniref:Uncharacterized protein n=1 Tax=Candidatus Magnetobacterium casense TaxID=1455061 RepID=A0ABS6RXY0_9BACT|nr:hypothetical protein [Candidatus Magnetobacterium casensis]MBV6341466.1 hypothetical protein [Candidatus Magnetobacterium casensis]
MTLQIKHPKKFNQTERVVVPKRNNHQSPEADTGHELTCISCGREIPAGYQCDTCKELFKARGRG